MARSPDGETSFLSTERSLSLPLGRHISKEGISGYYLDFSSKAPSPDWPPPWLASRAHQIHVETIQWALGCHERYLDGQGDRWLGAALEAGSYLLEEQEQEGPLRGGWVHRSAIPHTYCLDAPWLSGMAQGEGASLFLRLHRASGDSRFEEGARLALLPLGKEVAEGGVLAALNGGRLPEEYPTNPPSHVLNGAIFALWGLYDAATALGEPAPRQSFEEGVATLAGNLHLYDTGYWSRYDLFPHPMPNIASAAYHRLHIDQLEALHLVAPREELSDLARRFARYRESHVNRARAFLAKSAFRLLVPRNRLLANRLPWSHRGRPELHTAL
jgi:heparosan-N-sulfate-glucuronate 5-epimerase